VPDLNRVSCTRCKESIYNCMIEGPDGQQHRVPWLLRLIGGQPDDTGAPLDVLAPNIRVPSFVRALVLSPLGRIELCVKCVVEVFGVPAVTASEDPMYGQDNSDNTNDVFDLYREIEKFFRDQSVPMVDRHHRANNRAIHALAVGWGEAHPDDLPEDQLPRRRVSRPIAPTRGKK
jgi:hypothetical protein